MGHSTLGAGWSTGTPSSGYNWTNAIPFVSAFQNAANGNIWSALGSAALDFGTIFAPTRLLEMGASAGRVGRVAQSEVTVFRQGTFANAAVGWEGNYIKGKQWATHNPLTTSDYAKRYGLPAENTGMPDWVVKGRTQGPYTTRLAPPSYNNPANTGGASEILSDDVILDWFHMP